jgi:hypothetical protein
MATSYLSSEVQCAQRVASIAISLQQKGHFFVVGTAGASSFLGAFNLLIPLMRRKIQNATIIKLITAFKNVPIFKVVAPAA